jgi:glycosyltransferase involved in cell wall biosynthesis
MRRLVTRVWPLVRQRLPEARLLLAGRGTPDLALPSVPGVDVVGEVASSADFLRRLSVLLYPLERGSGMKVKVLESIATGIPVVTTPEGAEGVEAGDGMVVTSDDRHLAAATTSILADSAERAQRGSMARRAFMERYQPGPATEPLVDLYGRMA